MERKASPYKGVYYREHKTRKHGKVPDKYIILRHRVDGKQVDEGLGWISNKWEETGPDGKIRKVGWTLKGASELLAEFSKNKRQGIAPRSLAEKRQLEEAAKKQAEKEQEKQKAEQITVGEYWDTKYLPSLKTRGIKKTSYQKEIDHFEKRIRPAVGDKPLKDVNESDLEAIRDNMFAEGFATRTVKYCLGTFYRLWKHAAKRQNGIVKMGNNPAMDVDLPRENNTRTRVISPEELNKILEYLSVNDTNVHDLTLFCAYTGCRLSEAANLTWEYVNLYEKTATFPKTKNNEGRTIFLAGPVMEMLRQRGPQETGQYVFTKKNGESYLRKDGDADSPSAFRAAVKSLGLNKNRNRLDKINFHSLRHSAATFAARRGTQAKDMQLLFGWKTPDMVFRYVKGDADAQRRAMDSLANTLNGATGKILPIQKVGTNG